MKTKIIIGSILAVFILLSLETSLSTTTESTLESTPTESILESSDEKPLIPVSWHTRLIGRIENPTSDGHYLTFYAKSVWGFYHDIINSPLRLHPFFSGING